MGFFDKFKKNNRPNFEEIDSIEKAKEELSKGNLEILYLISNKELFLKTTKLMR